MNALVSADEALERGEVPTVPHEGSPVLWAEWTLCSDGWRAKWRANHVGEPLGEPLPTEDVDYRGFRRTSRADALHVAQSDLLYARQSRGFGAPALTDTASSTTEPP